MRNEDRARWTKLVADYESADLSQREFAQERGISLSNLRYWIYRLRKESRPLVTEAAERSDQAPERAAAAEISRLLPVRVVASAPKARTVVVAAPASDGLLVRIPAKPIGHSGRCRSPVPARRSPG